MADNNGFRDTTRTMAGHHPWSGGAIGGVENFHPDPMGHALIQRQTPTTQVDVEAGGRNPLRPGYKTGGTIDKLKEGGKVEKHFHVHHHYHGGKVSKAKMRKMEMQSEKTGKGDGRGFKTPSQSGVPEEMPVEREPDTFARGGSTSKSPFGKIKKGALHRDMGIPQGKPIPLKALRAKEAKDKKDHNVKGIRRDVFAINAKTKFHHKADGGHIHDDTTPTPPDYRRGGKIVRKNAGGALYATGGTIDKLARGGREVAHGRGKRSGGGTTETRRIARQEVNKHERTRAPEGHRGLGRMIAGRK